MVLHSAAGLDLARCLVGVSAYSCALLLCVCLSSECGNTTIKKAWTVIHASQALPKPTKPDKSRPCVAQAFATYSFGLVIMNLVDS